MFLRLLALFITIPLVELYLFLSLGSRIGIGTTVVIVILTGFLGAWLTKSQGLRTLIRYQENLQAGKIPHREIVDGLLILIAGAVLLTPGFLTDIFGFALLIPTVRAQVRKFLSVRVRERVMGSGTSSGSRESRNKAEERDQTQKTTPEVITVEAEVIEERVHSHPKETRE